VRLNLGSHEPSTFRLSSDDAYTPTGGLLIADYPLTTYIEFAYKLSLTREQWHTMYGHLPNWVQTDNYAIHARTDRTDPTKDQIRLMMQSLLKERFGLVVHLETQETPVLEMTLMKPGTLGPQLHRHEDGPACDLKVARIAGAELKDTDIFPSQCGGVEAEFRPNQTILMGSRNVVMGAIADSFEIGRVDRPVVDATGLTGRYDFKLTWSPNRGDFAALPGESAADPQGTRSGEGAAWTQAEAGEGPAEGAGDRSCRAAFGELAAQAQGESRNFAIGILVDAFLRGRSSCFLTSYQQRTSGRIVSIGQLRSALCHKQ
jgi:uncharacterized protein (TIGR03435 family)